MSLSNFFYINMPYGMKRNANDEWFAFNREYVPLGWNKKDTSDEFYKTIKGEEYEFALPVYTKFRGLTENLLLKIIEDPEKIHKNEAGEITHVFFYYDGNVPTNDTKNWNRYFKIIKTLSKLDVNRKRK